ncbi:MAG: hypothetical protein ACFB3T_09475 [Geminicoccaceae bacterium]
MSFHRRTRPLAIAFGTAALLLLALLVPFSIPAVIEMPPNALLLVDRARGHFFSPACLERYGYGRDELREVAERIDWQTGDDQAVLLEAWAPSAGLEVARLRDVQADGLAPAADCANAGGFAWGTNAAHLTLARLGVLELPRRWRADGSWNW